MLILDFHNYLAILNNRQYKKITEIDDNCKVKRAYIGPTLSASRPNANATKAKSKLPTSDVSELIVALCSSENSFCNKLLLATMPVPKPNDVNELTSGVAIVGYAIIAVPIAKFAELPHIKIFNSPNFLINLPATLKPTAAKI